jgi:hypothetical protein
MREIRASGAMVFVGANIRAAASCDDVKFARALGRELMIVER